MTTAAEDKDLDEAAKAELNKLTQILSGDEAKNRLRFNEQAALMLNIGYLHNHCKLSVEKGKEDKRSGYPEDSYAKRHQRNFVKNNVGVSCAELGAFLYKTEFTNYLFNRIDNKFFNALVPTIKLYKVFYPYFIEEPTGKRLDFSKSVSWKIPFNDSALVNKENKSLYTNDVLQTDEQNDIEFLQENGRLKGGGIKSFYYKYVGTNPAESNSNIEAELELFFEDITSFINEISITDGDKRLLKKSKSDKVGTIKFKYSDLVVPSSVKSDGTVGPGGMTAQEFGEYFRIKVVSGYAEPDVKYLVDILNRADIDYSTLSNPKAYIESLTALAQNIRKAILSAKICFFLTPYSHDINFMENGSISVKIKYIAAIEQIINDINILTVSDQYKKMVEENEKYRKLIVDSRKALDRANCKQGKDVKDEKEKEANAARLELENKIDANHLSLYKDIYTKLFGLNPNGSIRGDSKIWEFKADPTDMGVFGSAVVGNHHISKYSTKAVLLALGTAAARRSVKRITALDDSEVTQLMTITKVVISDDGIMAGALKKIGKTIEKVVAEFRALSDSLLDEYNNLNVQFANNDAIKTFKVASAAEAMPVAPREEEEDKEIADIIEEQILEATPEFFDAKENPLIPVKFIFLGDILDVFLDSLDLVKNAEDKPRIILGSLEILIPQALEVNEGKARYNVLDVNVVGTTYKLNIADIPISLRAFQSFFVKKIVKEKRENYPLLSFIYDLMYEVVGIAISPAFFGNFTKNYNGTNSFRLSTLSLTLPARDPKKDAIFKDRASILPFSGNINPVGALVRTNEATTYIDDEYFKYKLSDMREANMFLTDDQYARSTLNYLMIYNSTHLPSFAVTHAGDADLDADLGVYHVRVGRDTGLVKSINFSKTQNLYQKEALANREGTKNSSVLKDVYDVEVILFGNNIFRPGDFIYIEPLYLTGQQAVQLQSSLGLGGYYQVVDVTTTLSDSKYETKINCVLYAHVTGTGKSAKVVSAIKYEDTCDD